MNRTIRAAAAAALLTCGLGSVGCVHTDGSTPGDHYRNWVDPCYPQRYEYAARQAVIYPFAQQTYNGHVLNQTLWNYYFVPGTDQLTPMGAEKLDSLARVRPGPDPRLYIQTARDLPETGDPAKLADARAELDAKRAGAVQRYMSNQPAFGGPVAYEVFVHDPSVPGIYSTFAEYGWRGSLQQYRGNVSGGGTGVLGTGGGGANLTAPLGGGAGGGGAGTPPATGFGTR
jgi:hypothetical protein